MAWQQARAWRCRPSDLLFIEDHVAAYCLNRAVYTYGSALEEALDNSTIGIENDKTGAKAENARKRVLTRWIPEASSAVTPTYRDPGADSGGQMMEL